MPSPCYRLVRPTINGKPSAVWYATWREGGRSHRASSGEVSKARAEEWLEQWRAIKDAPRGAWTVTRIMEAYVAALKAEGKGAGGAERAMTSLLPVFGAMTPDLIRQSHVNAYVAQRRKSVTDATLATDLRYLRSGLNWAHREGHIDPPRAMRIPAGKAARKRFFTEAEYAALVEHCDLLRLRVFMAIAINTASRPTKIYRLRWSDIDAARRTIYFEEGNRTKRTRPVTINDSLAWVLGVAYQARLGPYVVERDGKPVQTLKTAFKRTCEAAGVQDAYLRDFRGTAASWALQRGAPIALVADLLGDSVEVVERHYGHFSPSHIAAVTDLLG